MQTPSWCRFNFRKCRCADFQYTKQYNPGLPQFFGNPCCLLATFFKKIVNVFICQFFYMLTDFFNFIRINNFACSGVQKYKSPIGCYSRPPQSKKLSGIVITLQVNIINNNETNVRLIFSAITCSCFRSNYT